MLRIELKSEQKAQDAVKLTHKIIENIVKNPQNDKFKRVKFAKISPIVDSPQARFLM